MDTAIKTAALAMYETSQDEAGKQGLSFEGGWLYGSHCYGTATPGSDIDVRAIHRVPLSRLFNPATPEKQSRALRHYRHLQCDVESFEFGEAIRQGLSSATNLTEMLFLDASYRLASGPLLEALVEHRESFLSQGLFHAYQGLAQIKLKAFKAKIKKIDHGEKIMTPPRFSSCTTLAYLHRDAGSRSKFDLEAYANDHVLVRKGESCLFLYPMPGRRCVDLDAPGGPLMLADKATKVPDTMPLAILTYDKSKVRHFQNQQRGYESWLATRNPQRLEDEITTGYDGKSAYHIVRALRMAIELGTQGAMIVTRPDADHLRDIRQGLLDRQSVLEEIEALEHQAKACADSIQLPPFPDRDRIALLYEAYAR